MTIPFFEHWDGAEVLAGLGKPLVALPFSSKWSWVFEAVPITVTTSWLAPVPCSGVVRSKNGLLFSNI